MASRVKQWILDLTCKLTQATTWGRDPDTGTAPGLPFLMMHAYDLFLLFLNIPVLKKQEPFCVGWVNPEHAFK